MNSVATQTTETERVEPLQSRRQTHVDPNWADSVRNFWSEYESLESEGRQEGVRGTGAPTVSGNGADGTVAVEFDRPVVDLPERVRPYTRLSVSFHPLQEWEGYVTDIGDDTFTARLTDLTAGRTLAEEEAEIPIDELREDDREMLVLGGVFRWAIGYQRSAGGTKRRFSQIIFRRLPQWTEKDLTRAEEEGRNLATALKWE